MFRQAVPVSRIFARNAGSFAKLSVLGRVGADPVAGETNGGKEFVRYNIAINPVKDGPPSWFTISVFQPKQMELTTRLLKKGSLVHVEANVSTNTYEKSDGTTGYSTNYFQQSFNLISSPYNPEGQAENEN